MGNLQDRVASDNYDIFDDDEDVWDYIPPAYEGEEDLNQSINQYLDQSNNRVIEEQHRLLHNQSINLDQPYQYQSSQSINQSTHHVESSYPYQAIDAINQSNYHASQSTAPTIRVSLDPHPLAYIKEPDELESDSFSVLQRSPQPAIALLSQSSNQSMRRCTAETFHRSLDAFASELDFILARLLLLYDIHVAALAAEGASLFQELMGSDELSQLKAELSLIGGQWKAFVSSTQGEQALLSFYTMLSSHNVSLIAIVSMFTLAPVDAAQPRAVRNAVSAEQPASRSSRRSGAVDQPAVVSPPEPQTNSFIAHLFSFIRLPSPFTLCGLLAESRSYVRAHPQLARCLQQLESIIFVELAEDSAFLYLMAAHGRFILSQLRLGSQFLRRFIALAANRRSTHPNSPLRIIYRPERVFDELTILLLKRQSNSHSINPLIEPLLAFAKGVVLEFVTVSLLAVEIPALESDSESLYYSISPVSLASVAIPPENVSLTYERIGVMQPDGRMLLGCARLSIIDVNVEASDIGWHCKQLAFPYLQGAGKMHASISDASFKVEYHFYLRKPPGALVDLTALPDALAPGLPTQLEMRLSHLSCSVGTPVLRVSGSAMSSIYNGLLIMLTPILLGHVQRDLNAIAAEQLKALAEADGVKFVMRHLLIALHKPSSSAVVVAQHNRSQTEVRAADEPVVAIRRSGTLPRSHKIAAAAIPPRRQESSAEIIVEPRRAVPNIVRHPAPEPTFDACVPSSAVPFLQTSLPPLRPAFPDFSCF